MKGTQGMLRTFKKNKTAFFNTSMVIIGFLLLFSINVSAQTTISQWTYEPQQGALSNPTPNTGSGSSSLVGSMTNLSIATGINTGTGCGAQVSGQNAWAIGTAAPGATNESSGAQFNVATTGYNTISVRWDQRSSGTSTNTLRFQYTTDGATWNNFTMTAANTTFCLGSLNNGRFEANTTADQFRRTTVDLSAIAGVNNNPLFAFRVVAAHYQATGEFRQIGTTTTVAIGGTWRFDNVTVSGTAIPPPNPTVTLSANSNSASEASPGTIITVIATASSAVSGAQTVTLNGTGVAIPGIDYDLSGTTITIPNGGTMGFVNFTVIDDAIYEGSENAILTISNPSSGISLGATVSQTIAIADNDPRPDMRITEYMYNGSEFVEFTNIGNVPIDMTGWSFDDVDRTAGAFVLSGFGIVEAGESVLMSQDAESVFRSVWNLCSGIKVVGGNNQNLGNGDEMNLFNASGGLVDRLTYGSGTSTGPQTNVASAWVNAAGLGNNQHAQWTLSVVADAEGSYTSTTGGFVASPGKSTRATVVYNPCVLPPADAPTIVIDVISTTNLLDGGVSVSPPSPFAVSSVINDPADPAKFSGIVFTVADDVTPPANLIVTAVSSNQSVLPNANISITANGASRTMTLTPAAVGYSIVTVTVTDGTYNISYKIKYAASSTVSNNTLWHTGIADASAAIAIDDDYMIVGNDETNYLYVYSRKQPGLFVSKYDFNQGNILGLTDGTINNWKEVDIEAAARSINTPAKIYWLGSMSNNNSGESKPNRNRLFAVQATGSGASTGFSNAGFYNNLRQQLIIWGDARGYNFTAAAADLKDPKTIDGFNVEGMVFGPDNTTMYIGFRAPLVPIANRTKAVIAPIQNFETWFGNGSPVTNPVIGNPIELDLGGRGIRDLLRLSNGNYIIVTGSYGDAAVPAIYTWTGNATDAPVLQSSFNLTGLNAEAVMQINEPGLLALDKLEIISDNGDKVYYNDGVAAKDLPEDNFRKFGADIIVSSAGGVLPINFELFTATKIGNDVILNWKTGSRDDGILFDIQRSENGRDFATIHSVPAVFNQNTYSFTDNNTPGIKLYYRIRTRNLAGQQLLSSIRFVNATVTTDMVKIYPNPVVGNMFSIVTGSAGIKKINIYNSAGVLYRSLSFAETAKDIITEGWAKGYYIIQLREDDQPIITRKLVIQ